MAANPSVAVLVLNWNNFPDTFQCLTSLGSLTYPAYEIVLIDNGSTDGSPNRLEEGFPAIKCINLDDNLGFAGGNNQGLSYALEAGHAYCLLLNNDTELLNPEFLGHLVEEAENIPDLGALGPKIKTPDGGVEDTILPYPSLGVTIRNTLGLYRNDLQKRQEVDSVAGACVLVRSAAIREIGLLDEHYFMYAEETEWFFRMRKKGWKVIYVPVESVIHKGASSSQRIESRTLYIERRANVVYTLVKHRQLLQAILTAGLMIVLLGARILANAFQKGRRERFSWSMIPEIISAFRVKWDLAADTRAEDRS